MGKALVLDPFAGVSGDMWLALLVDLGLEPRRLEEALSSLPLPPWSLWTGRVKRGALQATRLEFRFPRERQPHRGLKDLEGILQGGNLPGEVSRRASQVFRLLAEAEARVHGVPLEKIHFHEVGALDTVGDVCGVLLGLHFLEIDQVWTFPVAAGAGFVECAHGRLPLPAPAAAALLEGFPLRPGPGEGERTTPTGAALLRALARPFPPEGTYRPLQVGYGAGSREGGPVPNVLRGWIAQVETSLGAGESLWEIQANLDDLTGEGAGSLLGELLRAGALDAWITQILMKKGRPGLCVSALAGEGVRESVEEVFFRETSTLGIRRRRVERTRLPRRVEELSTPLGTLRCKVRLLPGGGEEWSPEQDDLERIARERGISPAEVLRRISPLLPG